MSYILEIDNDDIFQPINGFCYLLAGRNPVEGTAIHKVSALYVPKQALAQRCDMGDPAMLQAYCAKHSLVLAGILCRVPPSPLKQLSTWQMHVIEQMQARFSSAVVWLYCDYSVDGSPSRAEHLIFQLTKEGRRAVQGCDLRGAHHSCSTHLGSVPPLSIDNMVESVKITFITRRLPIRRACVVI